MDRFGVSAEANVPNAGAARVPRDLLIPDLRQHHRACAELEVPGSAESSRHAAKTFALQKTLVSNPFRCTQSGSMPVAEDGQTPCLPRLAPPGSADLSLQVVSRRIDWPSPPLRSPNTLTARSRDRQICTMTCLTYPGHRPVAEPTPRLY